MLRQSIVRCFLFLYQRSLRSTISAMLVCLAVVAPTYGETLPSVRITGSDPVISVDWIISNGLLVVTDDLLQPFKPDSSRLLVPGYLVEAGDPPQYRYIADINPTDYTNRLNFFAYHPAPFVVEDYSSIVTSQDLGVNQWAGNAGVVNPSGSANASAAVTNLTTVPSLRFHWDFSSDPDPLSFCGYFWSLMGLTDTKSSFDGTTITTNFFNEYTLNLDDSDGDFLEPGGGRRIQAAAIELTYEGPSTVDVMFELKDTAGGKLAVRGILEPGGPQFIIWDFRDEPTSHSGAMDFTQAKVLTMVVKRGRIQYYPFVTNPDQGTLYVHRVLLIPDRVDSMPEDDDGLLDVVERRSCQYFVDWLGRKPGSIGFPQDRSNFNDLLTVGGVGFSIPSLIIASERGWISRAYAISNTLAVLRVLDDSTSYGPDPIGRVGYRGWFYHFLGVDGKRKMNYDVPETPEDESQNYVEVSTIDTSLAVIGILAAQSYFTQSSDDEVEIRTRSQRIFDSVDWSFMVNTHVNQFYLGWRPESGEYFQIPAPGGGYYSGTSTDPHTLDYYTDELIIPLVLSAGVVSNSVIDSVLFNWTRGADLSDGLIGSWPGALFTYQFMHAFLDTRIFFFPSCSPSGPINWYENSRKAMLQAIAYASTCSVHSTYGPDSWGITANEGPDDGYRGNGVPPVAVSTNTEQDGSVAYYPMVSAVSFGSDLRSKAISAMRSAWSRGHWHPRFGLPDAYHDNIGEVTTMPANAVRTNGAWVGRSIFAIDVGPMALHIENARSGLIWNLLGNNPNIQRGLSVITQSVCSAGFHLEAEQGAGDGVINMRSNASQGKTAWLHDGESQVMSFVNNQDHAFSCSIRYSNDNYGPTETIQVYLDEEMIDQFQAQDTGDSGNGWNVFVSEDTGTILVGHGNHAIRVEVVGGDGYGVEIDDIVLN